MEDYHMDKKKEQAEKLQIKLDKLLQTREKKKTDSDKIKKEIADLTKSITITKFKLFEIMQFGSDDIEFSNWAKRKINVTGNGENPKIANAKNSIFANNANFKNHANANSTKSDNTINPTMQNHNPE